MAVEIDRNLRLPETEYFPTREEKSGICLHHTVGGSARSTFQWWVQDGQMVGTAYLIARDGTVHEVFDPQHWAYQFGLRWPRARKIAFEKRFIGIEIASEGGLIEHEGELYCFDRISPRTRKSRDEAFDYGQDYRGYRYFDKYEPAQVDSLVELLNHLCDTFDIPRQAPSKFFDFYGDRLKHFKGIIGHTMVRRDKTDPIPDINLWNRLQNDCGIQAVEVGAPPRKKLTEPEIEELFRANMQELNKMYVPAGSMVKGLLMELERGERNTYIRLRDAVPNGHVVYYDFVQGDRKLVYQIGRALGFKEVTDSKLEVRNA